MTDGFLDFLRDRLVEAIGKNDSEFARRAGKDAKWARNLANWRKKPESLKIEALSLIAKASGRPLHWFLVPPEEKAGAVMVPRLDVRAAAGGGAVNASAEVEDMMEVPRWLAERLKTRVRRLAFLTAYGQSMEPLIPDRALLLIDTEDRAPNRKGGIFVFREGDETRVKRLQTANYELILAISENPTEAVKILRPEDITIHGRVVWWDNWADTR